MIMKKISIYAALLLCWLNVSAQRSPFKAISDLPTIYIAKEMSLHFISPENIVFADLSGLPLSGDMPVKNVLRIKLPKDSLGKIRGMEQGLVTITGEHFMAQFRLLYSEDPLAQPAITQVEIVPEFMKPLDIDGISFSRRDFKAHAYAMLSIRKDKKRKQVEALGISLALNHVYTAGDYIFLDLEAKNQSNLCYDIDSLRFSVRDKKITKATNVQSFPLETAFQLYDPQRFEKSYRNIFAIKKLTFPGNKVLEIELSEKQTSGRVLRLEIPYKE
ncbi:MAG: DUF4138 domain-containing protein, partial [Pedobacter sp.]